ncbi:MAG: preprotein translocase subunit SecG [Clostridiales bacterium]|jgi:preprotein translocase subunit SecG|nr:secG [Oscillospiraceae bacterium]MDN5378666.1 preprotein translocase subunit SecG [Clostridiales bacterium]
MSAIEIAGGILLLIACIFIIIVTLLQENKQQGMTSAIGGGSNDSFYGRNSSRTREAKLVRITKVMIAIFFIVTVLVNLLPRFFK